MSEENLGLDSQDAVVEEKMLPVSRVNELVASAKAKGREQTRAELDALKQEIESLKQQRAPGIGGMEARTPSVDDIYSEVHSRLQSELQQQREAQEQEMLEREAQEVATRFKQKMGMGKEHFADFDEVMSDFNVGAFPELVFLATQHENTPQIMYELAKNPNKLATLDYMIKRDPVGAQKMIGSLSKSIQSNDDALAQAKTSPDPLNRLKPSTVGADNGSKTIRDLRKQSYLRG